MRSCRTPGSVRGVLGNRHPYRDHPLRHALIEKLAGTIAQRVPEDVRITRVSVTIRKPAALDHGEPGVTIWREQES